MVKKQKTCTNCGAPSGAKVTRRKDNPSTWALDTDLAAEYPDTWGQPVLVALCASGLCRRCDGMKEKSA